MTPSRSNSTASFRQASTHSSSVAPNSQQIVPEYSHYMSTIAKCWPRYRNFLNEYGYRSPNYGPYYYDRFYHNIRLNSHPYSYEYLY